MKITKAELADLLEGFVNGTCGEWDWDDFVSVQNEDPEIEKIRQRCEQLDVEFPPTKPLQLFGDEGKVVVMGYVRLLRAAN